MRSWRKYREENGGRKGKRNSLGLGAMRVRKTIIVLLVHK